VATAKDVSDELVSVIEPVGALQPRHARHQIRVGGFQHDMAFKLLNYHVIAAGDS
jgi:hypothetical protein